MNFIAESTAVSDSDSNDGERSSDADVRQRPVERRPHGVDDDTVAAVGKVTEAFEWLERARGCLYDFHHMMGRADLLMSEAADLLGAAGHEQQAELLDREVVGRNVLDGRWTFQIVEEFDDLYYEPVVAAERAIREALMAGRRHVYESEMKDERRSEGRSGHERRPGAIHPRSDEWRDAFDG
jgi:hypothetical protein